MVIQPFGPVGQMSGPQLVCGPDQTLHARIRPHMALASLNVLGLGSMPPLARCVQVPCHLCLALCTVIGTPYWLHPALHTRNESWGPVPPLPIPEHQDQALAPYAASVQHCVLGLGPYTASLQLWMLGLGSMLLCISNLVCRAMAWGAGHSAKGWIWCVGWVSSTPKLMWSKGRKHTEYFISSFSTSYFFWWGGVGRGQDVL